MAANGAGAAPADTPLSSRLTPPRSLWIGIMISVMGLALAMTGVILLGLNQGTLATHRAITLYPIQLTIGLPCLILGGLIFARRPENAIGWLIGGAGLAGIVSFLARQYMIYALLTRPGSLPFSEAAAWVYNLLWGLIIDFGLLFILLYPTGKLPSRRWWPVLWLDWAVILALGPPFVVGLWSVSGIDQFEERGAPAWPNDWFALAFAPLLFLGLIASLAAAIARYRHAESVERAQIRWILYAGFCWIGLTELSSSLLVGTPLNDDATSLASGSNLAFLFLPFGIGVAIFRYHLFEIDRLINRTIVYGLLTAILAGVYVGGVALLQVLLRPLTGGGNDLAVVATTLGIAALALPLRRRVQDAVDHRFYRRKYDSAKTVAAFGAYLRDEVELDRLTGRLVAVVDETMRPAHVGLWLYPAGAPRPTTGTPAEQ